ncbi:M23 family metallopeptidase [Emticicia sp. CRIBPO]|uniref:M23 family metallopeptidase n=1 Tax=Emticicia sp. CRIBPO TaxID=2683258 RepID=UPI001E6136DA|nr:M23 family metallopeptidase [Emticicia sp. CRIBPO]
MKILMISLNFVFTLFTVLGLNSDQSLPLSTHGDPDVFFRFKNLLVSIREQTLEPEAAREEFKSIMREVRQAYPAPAELKGSEGIVFPLAGSNYTAVGGGGTGYRDVGFDLFDHTVSGSHPAHDIFILDRNYDCVDDRKNKYIDIVSVGNGIVLATEKNWQDTSSYRGGNYVWVYDFERGGLWYYAHHRKVVVEPGQIVAPGDKLGEVGRTGFNAINKRSDTHLHLMFLALEEDLLPCPVNHFAWLKQAKTVELSSSPQYGPRIKWTANSLKKPSTRLLKSRFTTMTINYKKKKPSYRKV